MRDKSWVSQNFPDQSTTHLPILGRLTESKKSMLESKPRFEKHERDLESQITVEKTPKTSNALDW